VSVDDAETAANAGNAANAAPATIAALLAARLQRWSEGSLAALCERGPAREDPGEPLGAHLWRHRDELLPWLQAAQDAGAAGPVVAGMRAWLRRWLWSKNQFLALDEDAAAQLGALALHVVRDARAALAAAGDADDLRARLGGPLAEHRAALAGFVRARLGDQPRDVTCGHYSPALQLEVLGLAESTIADPVLDIGCGAGAELVQALRSRGHDARGIDRDVPAALGLAVDWLRHDYGVDRWGTVISHLGFSLHFLHHHLAGQPSAYTHAEVYMQVLRSLAPGGVFAYAPGLPFIEAMLPRDRYRVTRVPLPAAHLSPTLRRAQLETGLALGQATQIRRIV
jgi:SAM-dependent methyltransferase